MKKVWEKRLDEEAVSPVIAVILMVAITVVLAAVLYVTVQQMAETNTSITPTGSLQATDSNSYPGNWTINLITLSDNVAYDDVYITITLASGSVVTVGSATTGMEGTVAFTNTPSDANENTTYTKVAGATSLSSGDVLILKSDVGKVWDDAVVKYIYIPTGGQMASKTLS